MNNYMTEKTELPAWMCRQEDYIPSKDREAFLTKSTKSVLAVLTKLRFHEGKDGRFSASPSLKLFYTIVYIILTACSRNYLFVLIMCAAVTVRLAFFAAKSICQVLSGTAGAVLISVLLLLPAVFMGNPQTLANITARVYVSVTLVGILSAGTSWNKLTGSMRTFRIPSLFIFTLDITLKYISVVSAYIYLVIFTVIEVYALTAMANLLVKFDNGTNRGFIFGVARLLLSIATVIVMNLVPHLFLL